MHVIKFCEFSLLAKGMDKTDSGLKKIMIKNLKENAKPLL